MSHTKHTPGPWAALREGHDEWVVDLPNEREGPDGRPYMLIPVATVRDNPSDDPDELEANARLIAAAPLMLEALENLENDSGDVMPDSAWELVQQAVEAATGRRKPSAAQLRAERSES